MSTRKAFDSAFLAPRSEEEGDHDDLEARPKFIPPGYEHLIGRGNEIEKAKKIAKAFFEIIKPEIEKNRETLTREDPNQRLFQFDFPEELLERMKLRRPYFFTYMWCEDFIKSELEDYFSDDPDISPAKGDIIIWASGFTGGQFSLTLFIEFRKTGETRECR